MQDSSEESNISIQINPSKKQLDTLTINLFNKILQFHAGEMEKVYYPFNLTLSQLSDKLRSCYFFPSPYNPKIFFMIDNEPKLKGLNLPVINRLTLLKKIVHCDVVSFINYLRKLGSRFLVITESYNKDALRLLKLLQPSETDYCQQKLLCFLDKLNIEDSYLSEGIVIRNFVQASDEHRYANYYNQVLGFLIAQPVDNSFMHTITSRSSFNPLGYFLAEKKGTVIGFLSIEKAPWGLKENKFGYIYQIGVSKQWRGTGLSNVLLSKAKVFAECVGIDRIGVGVRKSNTVAVNFFKKHGFTIKYELKGFVIEPEQSATLNVSS